MMAQAIRENFNGFDYIKSWNSLTMDLRPKRES